MKKFMKEFKTFISRGNVMDMAVGVIIGGAFKAIVDSLVADIINPVLGVFGGVDFSAYKIIMGEDVSLNYGSFISSIINFLIMAFIIFMIVKGMNKVSDLTARKEESVEEQPITKICPYCRSEIAIEACRCPHCTTVLDENILKEIAGEQKETTIE